MLKRAEQIMAAIQEALQAGRPVYVTDGTVTQLVQAVEIDECGIDKFLTIHAETQIMQYEIDFGDYVKQDWGMVELSDGLYFAPEWWIKL